MTRNGPQPGGRGRYEEMLDFPNKRRGFGVSRSVCRDIQQLNGRNQRVEAAGRRERRITFPTQEIFLLKKDYFRVKFSFIPTRKLRKRSDQTPDTQNRVKFPVMNLHFFTAGAHTPCVREGYAPAGRRRGPGWELNSGPEDHLI